MKKWFQRKSKFKQHQASQTDSNVNYELQCIPKLQFLYEQDITEKQRNDIIAFYFNYLSNDQLEKADAYINEVRKDFNLEPEEERNFAKELFDKITKGEQL